MHVHNTSACRLAVSRILAPQSTGKTSFQEARNHPRCFATVSIREITQENVNALNSSDGYKMGLSVLSADTVR